MRHSLQETNAIPQTSYAIKTQLWRQRRLNDLDPLFLVVASSSLPANSHMFL